MRIHFDPAAAPAERDALAGQQFAGLVLGAPERGPRPGGRTHALRELHGYDAGKYGKTRNYTDAPVSRLSPYLRHGMVSSPEVRDHLRERYKGQPEVAAEYLKQLAWRDFFDKVLDWHGPALQDDVEPAKHRVPRRSPLPADIEAGATGLPCMDSILGDLFTDGYLHNHERLWLAAYVCHFRGIKWQEGARLFRQYLYDGDSASNSASWQWVESTFANKPYFMNQENVAHFSHDKWCSMCRVKCPFRASYEDLQVRLFDGAQAPLANNAGANVSRPVPLPVAGDAPPEPPASTAKADAVVWVHDAAMSAADPTLVANPGAAVVFVFDRAQLEREPWAFHRVAFVLDGLADLFTNIPNAVKQVRIGDPAAEVAAFARDVGAKSIALTDGPYPGVRETAEALREMFAVSATPRPVLAEYAEEPVRFTRYWNKVEVQVLGTASKGKRFHK